MFAELLTYHASIFCSFAESKDGFLTYELRPLFNNRSPHRKSGKYRDTRIYDTKVKECIEPGPVFNRCQLAADILGLDGVFADCPDKLLRYIGDWVKIYGIDEKLMLNCQEMRP